MQASDILGFNDLKTKTITVDAWKCELTIRELSLDEGIRLLSLASADDGEVTLDAGDIAQIVAWGVIDPETDERLFSDDDIPQLMRKNSKPMMEIYMAIAALSGGDAEKN